ncbi:DUF4139 domain-containing protein [Streptomyces sp. NPDC091281]|uniref:DUF4139 domain-containing protein n=1 Tax=Streptomyces sp. NPDC091281 TaxID=3365985 RepID=UPI00381B962E
MSTEDVPRWGSALDSVVVYARGAVCRRLARGSVPPDGRVRVTGLPRSLGPGSLRARVVGTPGLRVVEARTEVDAAPVGSGPVDELRAEARRLADALDAVRARRDRQVERIGEVGALRPTPPSRKRDDPHRRTPVAAWLELADFAEQRLTALHSRLGELEQDVREAEHALDVAEDRLRRASTDAPSAHVETSVVAVLTLDGTDGPGMERHDRSADVEVELEYGVPGAVWVPAYRLLYRQGDDGGRLVLRASVAQRTGEDWTGVRVALSTADLRRRTDLPKLRSVRVGRRQEAPAPSGWREPPSGLADLFGGYDAAAAPAPRGAAARSGAAVGGAPRPVPPPPPAPVVAGYGGAAPDADAFYGGAREAGPGADLSAPPPFPVTPPMAAPPPPGARPGAAPRARRGAPAPGGAGFTAPAFSAAPPPPPAAPQAPPPGPPRPSEADLDYAGLVLSGPEEPAGRRGLLFPEAASDAVASEYRRRAESVAALPLPGHAVRPRESAGSFDHRYDAAARADIPSDGTWHTVTVTEIPVGLRTEYLCVPSVEETVYATLVLSNATDQALLAGPVEVTADDEFLVTAALPTLAPGGVRRVGLGPAEGIRVVRRTTLRESTSGLRNNTTVLDHHVRVELANRLARPVSVEVRERVPVTSEPDVRVEERADWTAPEAGTGPDAHAPGTRVWRVDLPAGGDTALDGGYEIRVPAGKALVGGNRRS